MVNLYYFKMFILFLKAVLIGLSIAMPIGPIATLLIKNSLTRGFKSGLAVGLGAALVEGIYSFVAASGFAFVEKFLSEYLLAIKLICGVLLILLGLFEIKNATKNHSQEIKMKEWGFFKTTFLVMLLTLANPVTIVFFAGVFAAISNSHFDVLSICVISFGAFFGSLAWTSGLSFFVAKMRHKISQKWIKRIRVASGVIIGSFGVYGVLGAILVG